MRATVWDTVGPLCPSRSAMRARMGAMPSSCSSNTVRRYISVVSIRSLTGDSLRRFRERRSRSSSAGTRASRARDPILP
ncbi:unannotated protein [freshwater metagenome]|uniref:Unannotated protein n=1 Tax=freshwater metagenome TaxID=449393 RepID=A0A6J7RFA7_9ZZZZ